MILINGTAKLSMGREVEKGSIVAVSITEPGGGSDVRSNLKTSARRSGERIVVNGVKVFTSNALYADYFLVLAQMEQGPTLLLLRRSDRIEVEPMDLTTMRGAGISTVHYNDAEAEALIGEEGKGLREALKAINLGRLGYAVIALGIAEGLIAEAVRHAKEKVLFGRSLIEHQGPRWMLAELYAETEALKSYVEEALGSSREVDPLKASVAKLLGARLAQKVAWTATQLQGGRGLAKGSLTERLSRDARSLDIGEGAREVLLDFIGSRLARIY